MVRSSAAQLRVCLLILGAACSAGPLQAQPASPADSQSLQDELTKLASDVDLLGRYPNAKNYLPDAAIYVKAVDWILRHQEFYKPEYVAQARQALKTGTERTRFLANSREAPKWDQTPGKVVLGYRSAVDGSYQPYALTLPREFGQQPERRWPLHLVLHGRGATLNEVNFIHQHDGKPGNPQADWIQLDVFGRTNNAYRFAGEADVFEALADVKRRYRIDERRIVLHGFSMGGAGSWHLGLHYPSLWCSVGPGAGFVNFYQYQKVTDPLPPYQDRVLSIYNPIDYTLNAYNVPICTYGGEKDEQLAASTEMVERATQLGITIKLLIGPGMGHAFHPESQKEFMAFHAERQKTGRPVYPGSRSIKFTTHTLKYNSCDWVTIHEMLQPYQAATVDAQADDEGRVLTVTTNNVGVLELGRDLASKVVIDGDELPLASAAEGLLPGVHFERAGDHWITLTYNQSLAFPKNSDMHKRHNLQGPIDDAFMQPFVCVQGTGTPWNEAQAAWANWTLDRFVQEFDKWMRGRVTVVRDVDLLDETIMSENIILFGDPGSNSILAKVLERLPIRWTKTGIEALDLQVDPSTHGVSLIYPNPMNPRRYVVINSGHTFHAEDFQKSNAWLFPRLGDIAIQKFEKLETGVYRETVVKADIFNSFWGLPRSPKP
ncbi:MAG: dienelactone hydrolase family protein [Planctomycetes bacterium]|nr:dienelactone hydrolase family protein [Planctomycetota bacterium]